MLRKILDFLSKISEAVASVFSYLEKKNKYQDKIETIEKKEKRKEDIETIDKIVKDIPKNKKINKKPRTIEG